jgi:hypothetical protein
MIDFNIDIGSPVKNNDIELVLQQIDILFDTVPTEVLGFDDYGSEYDRYLYNLQISSDSLKDKVYSDINSLQLFGFTPTVEVYLMQGTEQDIAVVQIVLNRYDESYEKIYKITQ